MSEVMRVFAGTCLHVMPGTYVSKTAQFMQCPACGSIFDSLYCPDCGTQQKAAEEVRTVPLSLFNLLATAGLYGRFQSHDGYIMSKEAGVVMRDPGFRGIPPMDASAYHDVKKLLDTENVPYETVYGVVTYWA